MSEQQTSIGQDLEHLFKKTTDANKLFLTEGAKFVRKLGSSNIKGEDLFNTNKQLLKDAVNLFVKLNIQHTENLIDLGVAITKRLNQNVTTKENGEPDPPDPGDTKPAFVLNVRGTPGTTVSTQFLLNSDKKEPITCNLKQTDYTLQNDTSIQQVFETTFTPQSFQILFGESQKVDIHIKIPGDIKEGMYLSNIKVDGFEHTFFSLYLSIASPTAPTNTTQE